MGLRKIQQRVYTVDDYFAIERFSEERHEYLDGEIYLMAGESIPHGVITVNCVLSLGNQLREKPCQVLTKDTKVRSGPSPKKPFSKAGLYSYPDVLVICGEPICEDENGEIVLNPTVIIEVLSPTTEQFDRGEKLKRYQLWNPSLQDCLLVSQDQPRIELHSRQAEGAWSVEVHMGLDASVALASIECVLKLADVYDRIDLSE